MAGHLTAFLWSSHGAPWPEVGEPVAVRADQVLLDEEQGLVSLLLFEALALPRHACDLALVTPGRDATGPDAHEDQRYLMGAAAAIGATFVRPGAGPPAAVHRRRFAAPGRSLAAAAPGAEGAGALAMLVLRAEPVELAAALAGEPLVRPRPPVTGVTLVGECAPGVGGIEILRALGAQAAERARGAWLEFFGPALATLAMEERIAIAASAGALLGAEGVVFPSDDRTRDYLRARGRDTEWRRAEGRGEDWDATVVLDLSALAPPERAVGRARLTALAEDEDLLALARALEGRRVGVPVEVIAGGRAARRALAGSGAFEALERAGVTVLAPESAEAMTPPEGAVAGVDPASSAGDAAEPWSVGALAIALAGAEGAAHAAARGELAPGVQALDPAELIEPPAVAPPAERGPRHRPAERARPLEGSLRGVVLLDAGDHARCDQVLAWGPRTSVLRGDAGALAAHVFRGFDEDFAARAAAHGGGFVVAGMHYGAGEPADHAARATAAAGVRAVFARSFAPRHARALAAYGVLPLLWRGEPADPPLAPGDELEIVDAAEALGAPPILVRHLTGGWQFEVGTDLDARGRELVRAGGLIGLTARSRPPAA